MGKSVTPSNDRRPTYKPELRERAAKALAEEGTYRGAADKLGMAVSRVHTLVQEHEAARRKEDRARKRKAAKRAA